MIGEPKAETVMTDKFLVLHGPVAAEDARRRLTEAGSVLAVLTESDGRPSSVVGPQGPAPLLLAGRDTPLRAIAESAMLTERLAEGAPGVVIADGDAVVGVVSAGEIRAFLSHGYHGVRTHTLGDDTLPGRHTQPRMVVYCECGARNEIVGEFVEGRTECSRKPPHLLKIKWK
jgi:hypothetical protein